MKKLYITLCTLVAINVGINLPAVEPGKSVEPVNQAPEKTSEQKTAEMNERAKEQSANKSKQAADAKNQKNFGTPEKPLTTTSTVDLNAKKLTDADVNGTPGLTPSTGIPLNKEATPVDAQQTESKMTPYDIEDMEEDSQHKLTDKKNSLKTTSAPVDAATPNPKALFSEAESKNETEQAQDKSGRTESTASDRFVSVDLKSDMTVEEFQNKYVSKFTKDKTANRKIVDKAAKDLGYDSLPEPAKSTKMQALYEHSDEITNTMNKNSSTDYTKAITDFFTTMYITIKASIKSAYTSASSLFPSLNSGSAMAARVNNTFNARTDEAYDNSDMSDDPWSARDSMTFGDRLIGTPSAAA
jgi:hypothetical protein